MFITKLERKSYITIAKDAENELYFKKSQFIAVCKRVETEAEAEAFLAAKREQYQDATHNVFAYRVGGKSTWQNQRYSDDGEPQGTSGPPIMNVLQGQDILDTIIVVTRYFGGILLGTGGLVQAYGSSASEVIKKAGLLQMLPAHSFQVSLPYRFNDVLRYQLEQADLPVEKEDYLAEVILEILVLAEQEEQFKKIVLAATQGQAQIKKLAPCYRSRICQEGVYED